MNATTPANGLHADALTVHLHQRPPERAVLRGVSFTLRRGELLGIVGANGAGKSTLLKALLGLAPQASGTVMLDGRPLAALPARGRARAVAYLAQGHELNWPLPVQDVVAMGRIPHVPDAVRDAAIVARAMADTGTGHLRARNVQTLSGGERARVLLARALAVQAPTLLADEPLAALDPAQQIRIMQTLRAKAGEGMAIAIVMHDLALATRFCTRLMLLHDGEVLADGDAATVCSDANLARGFGIRALRVQADGCTASLPWALSGSDE